MASELPFPLYTGFFPQMVLTVDELMHYRRLGKERVAQLVRIIDDADCIYRWTDIKARNGRGVQKAHFLDIQPTQVAQKPSILYKCSVHLVDVQVDEILRAIANPRTRDARRAMNFLHGAELRDTQTLLTFPSSADHKKPSYSYRTIKWSLFKAQRREGQKSIDFCYLEYAGKKKLQSGANSVVGFCIQESIARDRQVPTLERYDILRGQVIRTGILITKTHQSNILKVTAMAQIDGTIVQNVRTTMEEIMVDYVATVHRVKGLLERQRMGRLQYLDEWDWVATKERKACAVCLRGFYFHRKHHCATCGEVVCSICAPLRDLDEPLNSHTRSLRVCSVCMAQAGSQRHNSFLSGETESEDEILTTNIGTETYVTHLRYPKHRGLRREEPRANSVHSPLPPFRQERNLLRKSEASVSSIESSQSKKESLEKLVHHVRQIRDTLNLAISEAEEEEERHSFMLENGLGDPEAGAERYDEIYDRIMKIRETLDVSSVEFDAVLDSVGRNEPIRSSEVTSAQRESELAFNYSEDADSELESESVEFLSSRSSLLSASVQSLEHQEAGEILALSTREEADALEEALKWVHQAAPSANFQSFDQIEPEPAPSVLSVSKNRGIERLAQKIGRLQQRLEASQRESEAVHVPIVLEHTEESQERSPSHYSPVLVPALKQSRDSSKEKHVAIATPSSEPSRAPPDLVASLRGVMNSSELTHAPRRRIPSLEPSKPSNNTRRAPPPPPPSVKPPVFPSLSSRATVSSALTPLQGTTIYVYDPEEQVDQIVDGKDEKEEDLSSSDEEREETMTPALPLVSTVKTRDESGELRQLMEGLAKTPLRSRCSSGQSTGAPPTEKVDF